MNHFMKQVTMGTVLGVAVLVGGIGQAQATSLVNNFGLASPTSTITFDEIVFAPNTVVDTQYAGLGVAFTTGLQYDSQEVSQGPAAFPGITGHYLGNNDGVNIISIVNPFSIFFGPAVTAAAFGMANGPITTLFEALLGGSLVESFSVATTFDNPAQSFYGFTGMMFDEIKITARGTGLETATLIDNIQSNPVPEPSTIFLFGSGLAGLVAWRVRKHHA